MYFSTLEGNLKRYKVDKSRGSVSMNEEKINKANACYKLAEQKAAHYFKVLYKQVNQKSYVPTLTKDIESWKQTHMPRFSFSSFFAHRKRPSDSKDFYNYIQWLNYTGKLDSYLDRSISYIFMRDLGKALDSSDVQNRIQSIVDQLRNHLYHKSKQDSVSINETISMSNLYRIAEKKGIESTLIWLIEKLTIVFSNIPKGMDADHAKRKLIKIIAGVIMHQIEETRNNLSTEENTQKLDEAIRLGYSYGLTYPFIDDLLDSNILSDEEKIKYSDLIRTTLITGSVPELGEWTGENKGLIQYIHSELREAFDYIKNHQRPENINTFLEESYVFFRSQEVDREKDLSNSNYTNEELYVPIILKSASSRLIVRSVISAPEDKDYDNRTFFYGIYNQLADDFADMFDDLRAGAVTPYTYYMKYHDKRPDLINPFELYWAVISNLIRNVYHSDIKTCEVILNRAINGLKRYKERMGSNKYKEVMEIFASFDSKFNILIQGLVKKATDVDFFDKLLRDHVITYLRKEQHEQEEFVNTIETARAEINNILLIHQDDNLSLIADPIVEAANYIIEGDAKRLRPILTWVMGIDEYGLNRHAIVPLLKSLEYMHTASLIFDDLPSQDNAALRRGRPTLHQVYNIAIAELTGLFLTQKAIEEQASLENFNSKEVLHLIQYSAQVTEKMCRGQAMDLNSKGKLLSLEQLNMMCFYKTGLAFEASLIMPAILAGAKEFEMSAVKKFAYHIGIAFQIKDDLLDVEGDSDLLGKPTGNDAVNKQSTFVSVLGQEGAKKAMWEHYCQAIDALKELPLKTSFLKQLANYIVNRDH